MTEHDDHPSSTTDALASLVRGAAPSSFAPGFADRVVARLAASRDAAVSDALERHVRRIVPIVAAASLVLAAYNWWGARQSTTSSFDAALNLPSVTLSTAYSPSTLFGVASASETGAP